MQYMLKLTVLGVRHQVFRVVSIDGQADIEHVLSLLNLSFDYANYDDKALYFAHSAAAVKAFNVDVPDVDDDHYGPVANAFASFWEKEIDLKGLSEIDPEALFVLNLADSADKARALNRFDALIAEQAQMISVELPQDSHPRDKSTHFKFVYVVHGVQHLVEVMMSSEKLNCFLPATLMGVGLVIDNDSDKPLSTAMIDELLDAIDADEHDAAADGNLGGASTVVDGSDDEESVLGLNLKVCTSRMRALGAMRSSENINQALLQAGATALKVKLD